ncbi:DUF4145 domain-containing protein [uncultured Reyranella sp.]|uniref:DUF4145 domain-containing protein n=1 Tax=uncultured Reyranella sp. TaxID=735512 RepID=UPI00259C6A45|nr:DUF4145 domain-containing protein [uncultured Reyranella sp.]
MSILVTDCPRCGAKKITFDVHFGNALPTEYEWEDRFEAASVCRACSKMTVFIIETSTGVDWSHLKGLLSRLSIADIEEPLNDWFLLLGHVSLKDAAAEPPPEFVPPDIGAAFKEATTSLKVRCWNAAGAMFRLSIDLATKGMLPPAGTPGIKRRQREVLAERLAWLFENGVIPRDLEPLSSAIREDGNDGAHDGTLVEHDAHDLHDFSRALLERLYTEPRKVALAQERRRLRPEPPN